jgi:hypothetical protein
MLSERSNKILTILLITLVMLTLIALGIME